MPVCQRKHRALKLWHCTNWAAWSLQERQFFYFVPALPPFPSKQIMFSSQEIPLRHTCVYTYPILDHRTTPHACWNLLQLWSFFLRTTRVTHENQFSPTCCPLSLVFYCVFFFILGIATLHIFKLIFSCYARGTSRTFSTKLAWQMSLMLSLGRVSRIGRRQL